MYTDSQGSGRYAWLMLLGVLWALGPSWKFLVCRFFFVHYPISVINFLTQFNSSATSWSASSWLIILLWSSHFTSVIHHHHVCYPSIHHSFILVLKLSFFQILPSIDIWHPFGLISQIGLSGLAYGYFIVSFFSGFSYRYLFASYFLMSGSFLIFMYYNNIAVLQV